MWLTILFPVIHVIGCSVTFDEVMCSLVHPYTYRLAPRWEISLTIPSQYNHLGLIECNPILDLSKNVTLKTCVSDTNAPKTENVSQKGSNSSNQGQEVGHTIDLPLYVYMYIVKTLG